MKVRDFFFVFQIVKDQFFIINLKKIIDVKCLILLSQIRWKLIYFQNKMLLKVQLNSFYVNINNFCKFNCIKIMLLYRKLLIYFILYYYKYMYEVFCFYLLKIGGYVYNYKLIFRFMIMYVFIDF